MALESSHLAPVRRGGWVPALDIYETDEAITVTVDLPGVQSESLDLTVEDKVLTISGERLAGGPEDANYHRIERPFGEFQRSIQLPGKVDAERITASLTEGVLVVRIPAVGKSRARKIAVNSAEASVESGMADA